MATERWPVWFMMARSDFPAMAADVASPARSAKADEQDRPISHSEEVLRDLLQHRLQILDQDCLFGFGRGGAGSRASGYDEG
jgi:hypothetical protein